MKPAVICVLLLVLASAPALSEEWGPWETPKGTATRPLPTNEGKGFDPLRAGVRFFQKFISPVDGPRCRMHPTCSTYALQALEKHGPLFGVLLTVDRLLHEGSSEEHRHPVRVGGRVRFHDPVENSDFWLVGR